MPRSSVLVLTNGARASVSDFVSVRRNRRARAPKAYWNAACDEPVISAHDRVRTLVIEPPLSVTCRAGSDETGRPT